ncbi:hypothetical protein ACS0TY_022495 [Phlomoides rotata]
MKSTLVELAHMRFFPCLQQCYGLKAHFQDNPKDLDLLKHDKVLSKKEPAHHLRDVPEYLLDPTTKEASKIVKLARAAKGNTTANRRCAPKRGNKAGMKRKAKSKDEGN